MCLPCTEQRWQIVAPRLRQNHVLVLGTPFYNTSLLYDECAVWDAWSKLARPAAGTNQTSLRRKRLSRGPVSRLESLPAELLAMVLSCPELSKDDIICLGMASEIWWSHTIQHIDKHYHRSPSVGPWAGTEIACTGSYLTKLPPSFNYDNLALNSVSITDRGWMCTARKFNWAALQCFTSPEKDDEQEWRAAFDVHAAHQPDIPKPRLAQMSEELLSVSSTIRSSRVDAPWILRNLITKEFVRCLPTADSQGRRGYVDHPECKGLRLTDILTVRIIWTEPFRSPGFPGLDLCGRWAGHSFDIVPLDENPSALGKGWDDVTDAIVKESQKHLEWLEKEIECQR